MTLSILGRADLHMHTTKSDGLYDVQALLDYVAKGRILDVIAITDHDVLDSALWAVEHEDDYPFDIVPGIEVTSTEGHVLALWVTDPVPAHLPLAETVQAIHEAGGLAILAHPFHLHVGESANGTRHYGNNPTYFSTVGFDGVEVHNAGVLLPFANTYARRIVSGQPIAQLGNSDAHTLNAIGSGSSLFPGKTAGELHRAIVDKTTQPQGSTWSVAAYYEYTKGTIASIITK